MSKVTQHLSRGMIILIVLLFVGAALAPLYQIVQERNAKKEAQAQEERMKNLPKLKGTKLTDFKPVTKVDKLQKIDTVVGKGETVKPGANITVDYTGALAATGIIFESSKETGQPASLSLSEVIAGWSQGIPGMKVGGTRRLLIPAALAYGSSPPPSSGIPANADLVFDVTLYKIGK